MIDAAKLLEALNYQQACIREFQAEAGIPALQVVFRPSNGGTGLAWEITYPPKRVFKNSSGPGKTSTAVAYDREGALALVAQIKAAI